MQTEPNIRPRFASKQIPQRVFYLPFAYYYRVRLGTPAKLLSWGLIYLFPTAFYSCLATDGMSPAFLCNYILLLFAVFTLYETGYIYNDTFATRKEADPSIRLYPDNLQYFYAHYQTIIVARMMLVICVLIILLCLHPTPLWWLTSLSVLLIAPIFYTYNRIRNRYNVFLYPLLVFSRYIPFLIPYLNSNNIQYIGWLFLSFPLLNAIERFSMPRYRYPLIRCLIPNEETKSLFRAAYYVLTSMVATLVLLNGHCSLLPLIPMYILGAYRLAIYILTRFYTPKNYLKG